MYLPIVCRWRFVVWWVDGKVAHCLIRQETQSVSDFREWIFHLPMLGGAAGLLNLFEAVSPRHQLRKMQAGPVGQW